MAEDNLLAGVGLGNFGTVYPKYQYLGAGDVKPAHNDYLQVLAELGVPGLVAFLWLWAAWARNAFRRREPPARGDATGEGVVPMRARSGLYLVVALLWLAAPLCRADTIYLKNGRELDVTILEQNDDSVLVKLDSGVLKLSRDKIERIEADTPEQRALRDTMAEARAKALNAAAGTASAAPAPQPKKPAAAKTAAAKKDAAKHGNKQDAKAGNKHGDTAKKGAADKDNKESRYSRAYASLLERLQSTVQNSGGNRPTFNLPGTSYGTTNLGATNPGTYMNTTPYVNQNYNQPNYSNYNQYRAGTYPQGMTTYGSQNQTAYPTSTYGTQVIGR
jgi:hypothetical protein